MLQPRARHNPNEPRPQWQQRRHYWDHLGNLVALEEYIRPNIDPKPTEQLAIHMYSTPIDADHTVLRDHLLSSWSTQDPTPLFEIYSYCLADGFAYIENSRREIVYRKQERLGTTSTPNPAPLIPLFFHSDIEAYEAVVWPPECYPKGFEMGINRVRHQDSYRAAPHVEYLWQSQGGLGLISGFTHHELDVDEEEPCTSTPNCNLRYLLYAPFPSHLGYDELNDLDFDHVSCPDIQVWRGASMDDVARRLESAD